MRAENGEQWYAEGAATSEKEKPGGVNPTDHYALQGAASLAHRT